MPDLNESGYEASIASRWSSACRRFRFFILGFWFAVVIVGARVGVRFLDHTVTQFPSPKGRCQGKWLMMIVRLACMAVMFAYGSPSYAAAIELVTNFPQLDGTAGETLLLQAVNGTSVVEGPLADKLSEFYTAFQASLTNAYPTVLTGPVVAYYPIKDLMPALAGPLVSTDQTATIFIITYGPPGGGDSGLTAFLSFIMSEAHRLLSKLGVDDQVTVGLTGLGSFGEDSVAGVKRDAATMDTIVLPLALLILAMVVRSLPLMIVPMLTIPVTLLGQFLVMYPVALHLDVVSFAPSLMMSLTISMGIDYNLFMLTRYMSGLAETKLHIPSALTLMLQSAGYIILVSGSTLCVSFLGLIGLPMESLRSLGLGAAVSILTALAVNLSMVPALLHVLGPCLLRIDTYTHRCLSHITRRLSCYHDHASPNTIMTHHTKPRDTNSTSISDGDSVNQPFLGQRKEEDEEMDGVEDGDDGDGTLLGSGTKEEEEEEEEQEERRLRRSCWFALARVVVKRWWGAVIFSTVLAVSVPIMLQVLRIKPSVEFDLMLPYGSTSYETLHAIDDKFGGAGMALPYRLLMVLTQPQQQDSNSHRRTLMPNQQQWQWQQGDEASQPLGEGGGILSREAYDAMTYTIQQLIDRVPGTRLSDFTGVIAVGGHFVTYDDMQKALGPSEGKFDPYYFTLKTLAGTVVSSDQQATYATITLSMDPYSPEGQHWLESAREVLASLQGQTGLSIYLEGGGATVHDAVEAVLEVFPIMVTVTLTIVFVLIGIAFKSIVAPLRSVLTISITLAVVYGLTVLVYQDGALAGLGLRAVSQPGSVAWLPIVICFSIIVGLGLDYDVFLVSIVLEKRLEGHTDRSALVRGMVSTGHIITAAGVIMAVAFSGLLFSSELLLNQTAFLMVSSVLLDTFVVRTLLVPIIMTITGRYTWWPRRDLPPPTKDCRYL